MLYHPIVKDNYKVLLAQDLFGGSWLHLLTFIKQAKTKQSKSKKLNKKESISLNIV